MKTHKALFLVVGRTGVVRNTVPVLVI